MASADMPNLLLQDIQYKVAETALGTWRSFLYPDGSLFAEFTSHWRVLGVPFLHFTRGKCPETGKRITARGIIAVGRFAVGIVALGQVALGIVALGQVALGVLLGLGQACTGVVAVGQLAVALRFGLGQFVTGYVTIGQFGLGEYVLAQVGYGQHVWDTRGVSVEAERFFRSLLP